MIKQWILMSGGMIRSWDGIVNGDRIEFSNPDPADLKWVSAVDRRKVAVAYVNHDESEEGVQEAKRLIDVAVVAGFKIDPFKAPPLFVHAGKRASVIVECDDNPQGELAAKNLLAHAKAELG